MSSQLKEKTYPLFEKRLIHYLKLSKQIQSICDELVAIQMPLFDEKVSCLAIELGPKYMSSVDCQLSKPPFPTFSQFVFTLNNHELRIFFVKKRRTLVIIKEGITLLWVI